MRVGLVSTPQQAAGGVWKSGRQCPERGREWRVRLGSDKEGKSEERLLAWVSGLSYGEGGKEWLCPPSSSAPARLERCSNPVKTQPNMFADFFFFFRNSCLLIQPS